jgi:hypothetical protein
MVAAGVSVGHIALAAAIGNAPWRTLGCSPSAAVRVTE